MDAEREKEEKLRETACIGDLRQMIQLVEEQNVNVNAKNTMNGWTALHWASKRNHVSVVKYLLSKGADPKIENFNKELPAQLTNTEEIRGILQYEGSPGKAEQLAIIPNYLKNPVFPYGPDTDMPVPSQQTNTLHRTFQETTHPPIVDINELVLKTRIAYADEKDFIEVELNKNSLTYEALLTLLTKELKVDRKLVYKIRKLPNTIVRKDKDVKRLRDFQELELVLSNKAMGPGSYAASDISDGYKHEQILY